MSSVSFFLISSLNEDLRKKGKELTLINSKVLSLHVFYYCNYNNILTIMPDISR